LIAGILFCLIGFLAITVGGIFVLIPGILLILCGFSYKRKYNEMVTNTKIE
jgi:hypothetical protein